MKNNKRFFLTLGCMALLTGCATQRELIEKRIGEKADFFATLPSEEQQRLRDGKVLSGDALDAAWIVYGRPDRVFQKVTATATNDVWSYVSQDLTTPDDLRPAYHPVRPYRGRSIWRADTLWATDRHDSPYEYRRIEFQNNRILTIEAEKP